MKRLESLSLLALETTSVLGGDVTQFKVAIETKTHIPYDTVRETGYMIEAIIKK